MRHSIRRGFEQITIVDRHDINPDENIIEFHDELFAFNFLSILMDDPIAMYTIRHILANDSFCHDVSRLSDHEIIKQMSLRLINGSIWVVARSFRSAQEPNMQWQQNQQNLNSVYAVQGGLVFRAAWQDPDDHNDGLGWRISIQTKDGYDQYGHMDPNTTPAVGRQVQIGDYIGNYADPTNGHSTRPHVHYERRDSKGRPVNPGNVSPIPGGILTTGYGAVDNTHPHGHNGVDYVHT